MPSQSKKQQRFFGAVMGAKEGQKGVSGAAKKVAKEMPKKEIKKFLKTKKGAPESKDQDENYNPKKADRNKDGKVSDWEENMSKKAGFKKAPKKGEQDEQCELKARMRAKKNSPIKESASITSFIECILTKNYHNANKYLKDIINSKIEDKISKEIDTPLF